MTKDKTEVGGNPPAADFIPAVLPVQNCDGNFPMAPEMAELRYRLMVRRGQAWGNGKKLEHAF